MTPVTLASQSPRRRDLLAAVGFRVTVRPADADERPLPSEDPVTLATRLAHVKAMAARDALSVDAPDTILAADTVVHTDDGVILGKPADADDARATLLSLSGRTHSVTTGWCVASRNDGVLRTDATTTRVTFHPLDDALLDAYLATDEPWDKAGAYGIQGRAALFVARIEGCWSNVVGLPVSAIVLAMRELGRLEGAPWGNA